MTEKILLPESNRTPWEKAVSHTSADRRQLDVSLIVKITDPYTCPPQYLKWLAWAMSVDIWHEEWPDVKKRNVIAQSFILHRLKTTVEGIRRHIALENSVLVKAVRPQNATAYRRPAMTPEQRASYIAQLPQIRIFLYQAPPSTSDRSFRTSYQFRSGDRFRSPTQGYELIRRKAVLLYKGVETPLTLTDYNDFSQVILQIGTTDRSFHSTSKFRNDQFRTASLGSANIINMKFDPNGNQQISPGYIPTAVRTTRVSETVVARPAQRFRCSKFYRHDGFRAFSLAPYHIFDQISLFDPNQPITIPQQLLNRYYRGHIRYGIQPYTAELTVEVPMIRPLSRGVVGFRTGYRVVSDMTKYYDTLQAIVVSKALRDDVLVNTKIHRSVTLSDSLKLGTFKLGEIRRFV